MKLQSVVIKTWIISILLCANAQASETLAVIYPDVRSPFDQIFAEIIEGIDQEYGSDIRLRSLKKSDNPDQAIKWLRNESADMLIALGGRGYKVAKLIHKDKSVAIGALPIRPNGISGISLLAEPRVLFETLKELAPNITTVHVVYSPRSRWLINIAQEQASVLGLSLNNIEVKSKKAAVQNYEQMLRDIDPSKDAVWLPLDNVSADEQVILPNLLEKSWEQNLVLFSSKPEHAKRGALFSMFPDHEALGRQLVKMVTKMYQSKQEEGVVPLQKMKLAVNLRTAAHLGFDYKNQQKSQFHLTFPQ